MVLDTNPDGVESAGVLLGRAVMAAMDALGWTQLELAERSGLRQPRISEIKNRYRGASPTFDEISAIERAMDLPAGYFYGFAGLATPQGAKRGAEAAAKLAR